MPELLGLCRYHKEVFQRFVTCKLPQSLGKTSYLGDNVLLLGSPLAAWGMELVCG